ncbi:solute carrier family 25 member 44 isoform X1 [Hydra vulgaris]|nr:solute carrier family 25 member 44 [Hydra vulgaris]XP_047142191.1 solute carrier family 25 member 44 [Hydra vulgaris]
MTNQDVRHIEWEELDKRKYYVIGPIMMVGVRLIIFPPTLIKTRLQVQKQNSHYKGTLDAFRKIFKHEGIRGFYKGFSTNLITVASSQVYITTFEVVRSKLPNIGNTSKSLVAGVCASLAGQTITIPVDIISQKQMVTGQQADASANLKPKFKSGISVVKDIYSTSGLKGFYKGYVVSLLTYTPSSGLWWGSYYMFTQLFDKMTPVSTPHLAIQGISGISAGIVASTLTNPADTVRTRLQVEGGSSSIRSVIKRLYEEEGFRALHKGLTARLISSVPSSCVLAVSYELVKLFSLKS